MKHRLTFSLKGLMLRHLSSGSARLADSAQRLHSPAPKQLTAPERRLRTPAPARCLLALVPALFLLAGCGIYSFSGTSIQPDVKSITINYFEYKALKVNPSLSNDLTEAVRTRFRRMTNLEQVEMDGDLEITGEITGYDVRAQAVTAGDVAAQNRLTVTVKVSFQNRKYPEDDFSNKSFSGYSDYPSEQSLDAVEASLCAEIIDKIVEDLFNATVAQW